MYGKSVKRRTGLYGTYRLIKELGRSNNGIVYMAWHRYLRKHMAIKVVENYSTEEIKIHNNEFEALKNIKSVYIPQVFDFVIENNYSFIVIEYIEGESFDKLLTGKFKFTEAQIIKWYSQLASALFAIHKLDICHRDIKPANILLTTNGDICLIDFGSAYISGNDTGLISRSMGYASPEQYEFFKLCKKTYTGENNALSDNVETALLITDCKTETTSFGSASIYNKVDKIDWKLSDIYSLGATIYHLLTGDRPPVKEEETVRISKQKGYSKEILEIIEKSMKTTPSERYISAEELGVAILRV